MLTSRKLK